MRRIVDLTCADFNCPGCGYSDHHEMIEPDRARLLRYAKAAQRALDNARAWLRTASDPGCAYFDMAEVHTIAARFCNTLNGKGQHDQEEG